MKKFKNYNGDIGIEEIEELEKLIMAKLPNDYREHVLKSNGGKVSFEKEYIIRHDNREFCLSGFYPIKNGASNVKDYFNNKHNFLYPNLLPIGYIALGYKEGNYGEIYFYFSDELPFKVASSFKSFLKNIEVQDSDI
ncbi:SMI1 / KNR4 family (SUKH-1) [Tenacibaculum sp. MAR_2009_124]|uniref:SMI1/KNR4 family protein n=1 Tax=Tenacibaculum sp. MAR_2009_124 TaxID=1250059 RepID=UPI0008992E4A|nr:SMI1/KNR4 family protein [Tenacibaculum sp. MAR_2009_124]SEC37864.1 SMI1 / KNR4 family (SUKH-1) [Tenacibaculum sp. MAR_2009_124]